MKKYPTFNITQQHLGHVVLEIIIKQENKQDTCGFSEFCPILNFQWCKVIIF